MIPNRVTTVIVLASLVAVGAAAAAPPERVGQAAGIERRVEDLLGQMTLEEKIGQLHLTPNNPNFDWASVEAGRVGGVLAFTNARDVAAVQAVARRSRLGIPLLVGLDVLHGLRTMYPLPLGEAASFDPGLAREVARASARDAAAIGMNWNFAPMADLARDPRWGRMIEGFGEDPHVGAILTAARVRGFREGGLGVTLKHFVGYGAALGGRDYDAVQLGTGDLSDAYLPPFRAGIAAGAESVMIGFHALNRVPATGNRPLIEGILKGRLGFDGLIVSDWLAIDQLQDHGVAAGPADAAREALLAGVDMDMASGLYARHLPDEIAAGRVPEAAVTEAARRVLRAKLRMGLFDRPDLPPESGTETPAPTPAGRALARRAAQESMVLLKNDGVLPLGPSRRIALIGGMAADPKELIGPHAALVRWEDGGSALDAFRRRVAGSGATIVYAEGCGSTCESASGFEVAVAAARDADVVVAVMGEPVELTGEGASRAYLTLPGRQPELLDRLVATGKPVVLALLASRPIELGPVADRLSALLMAWYPGTEGGNAIADLLFGDVAPSAKLPVTWPRTIGQVPLTYDRLPNGRPPDPGNRFTLRYADEQLTPLYPFGFGLSYTRFGYSGLTVERDRIPPDGKLSIGVTLANLGPRAGTDVVQLYVRQPVARISRPLRQLKAFRKVALAAGETSAVGLDVAAADLGYTGEDGVRVVEPGRYEVFVGGSSEATLTAAFEIVPP